MADVLIAGGGPAGSALAILLGRQGRTVELYERAAAFPRDKPCGEGLMPAGVSVLGRLGLIEAVRGRPFFGIRYHLDGRVIAGRFPRGAYGLAQRRTVLDQLLFDEAARTPGVTAHLGARVDGPILERGRVRGLMVEGRLRPAKLVVAADGARSVIRRALGIDMAPNRRRIGLRRHYRLPVALTTPFVEVFLAPGCELYLAPLPAQEVLIAALSDCGELAGPPRSLFETWWRSQPELAKWLDGAAPVNQLRGACPLAARARCGVGPGFVLLGDAAGFIDPITGGGMAQALTSAELLARSMPRYLDGDESWLWRFERSRARMLRPYRLLTEAMLRLSNHRRIARRVLGLVRAWPGLFSRLLAVAGGS
jgi:flavin-dependent dehydrogenase